MNEELATRLIKHYEGPPNRNRDPKDLYAPIRVDDQTYTDRDHLICKISVVVSDYHEDVFALELVNPPWTKEIQEHVLHRGSIHTDNDVIVVSILLRTRDTAHIRELEDTIRNIHDYDVRNKNWAWVSRRAADSLVELAETIEQFTCVGVSQHLWQTP